jgi:hypothetical protein
MSYLVWKATYAGKACHVLGIENVRFSHKLIEGHAYGNTFPENATLCMSPHFKRDTELVDDVMNADDLKVCSRRLVDFLKSEHLDNVEYLPVTILDHKGKVASKEYSVVNPVGLQDAIDMQASVPTLNASSHRVDAVERLIFVSSRIDPKVKLFRFAGLTRPVMIEKSLADALMAQNFVGLSFLNPSTVTS